MFTSLEIQEFIQILNSGHHVRILSHRNPDADAIGSMIVFARICEHFNLTYDMMSVDPVPSNLEFLIDKDINIQIVQPESLDVIQNEQTDILVFLDCGQINRAGNFFEYILPHQRTINIDHHMSNPYFADFNKVEDISSTCELLYSLITMLDIPLNKSLATVIYTGILTDTGMFQYDKTTPKTHEIIATLLEYNIDHFGIFQHVYQNQPINMLNFLSSALSKVELVENSSIALLPLAQDELIKLGFDDIHYLFPIIMSIHAIECCVILKEKEDRMISVSLRSKNHLNVAEIAQKFLGGGHIRAAGCRTNEYSLNEFKKIIHHEIKKHL